MPITLYGLDKCDTCRKARNWLDRREVAYDFVDYRVHPLAAATLREWASRLGGWDQLVNRASTTWRKLPPSRKAPGSEAEWTLLLKEYPVLIRRPLSVLDDGSLHQGFTDKLFARLFA